MHPTDERPPGRAKPRPVPPVRTRPISATPSLAERFWAKVDRSGGADACWLWQGKSQNGGYGVIHLGGAKTVTGYAHRVSWMIHCEGDPVGKAVCHRCDVPSCVNPAHLFLGTIADNVRDMIAKGRCRLPARRRGVAVVRGERVGSAKLTEAKVREIRARAAKGEGSGRLGAEYVMDSSTVRQIVRRVIWKHVA